MSNFDHVNDSDDETTAVASVAKAKQTASRYSRVTKPKSREALTAMVQAEQRRRMATGQSLLVTPPCTWCGLPTGCFCDKCQRAVCSTCDRALGQCVYCFQEQMGCSEGKARQHGALLLKNVPEKGSAGSSLGQSVDPAFAALPFAEQAQIFLERGIPVDPNAELQERCKRVVPSKPRQRTEEELAREEEARVQRARALAVQEEVARRRALQQAEETAKIAQQIDLENSVAKASRSSRRHGAGATVEREGCVPMPEKVIAQKFEEPRELTKAQVRRLRQRASRAAASARKVAASEERAKEEFLKETAAGFTERLPPESLEPKQPQKSKEPKVKPCREVVENKIGEGLLLGLWEAKLKH